MSNVKKLLNLIISLSLLYLVLCSIPYFHVIFYIFLVIYVIKLCPLSIKPMPTFLLLPTCLVSFPFYQPRLDRTLNVIDLVPSLKNHTLSSILTHGTLDLDRSHPSSIANPRQHHSTMVFSLSSHFFSLTRTTPPNLFLCLIFVLFDL